MQSENHFRDLGLIIIGIERIFTGERHPLKLLSPAFLKTGWIIQTGENMEGLQEILGRIPGWQNAQLERIAGLTNANYRVTLNREQFVLRVSGQNTELLGINRNSELVALKAAAAAGIGPEVVMDFLPEGHLVTRWIQGRHWEVGEFRTPANVRMLTETVKRIHALPSNGANFSSFQRVASYQELARGFGVPLPSAFETFLETMHAVEKDQQDDPSGWLRFCHNDLVSVNYLFVEEEQTLRVLDWEFSGLGDLYYDLATIVYTHDSVGPIPLYLEEVMLACYFGTVHGFQRRRLMGMKFMLMLFTGFWGLAQHGMQQAGLIPAVEGFDYLEFANYLFEHELRVLQDQYHRAVRAID